MAGCFLYLTSERSFTIILSMQLNVILVKTGIRDFLGQIPDRVGDDSKNMPTPKYFSSIIKFFERHRRLPTYREILALTGFKSKNAVYRLVERLVALRLLARDSDGKIIPGKKFGAMRVLGTVEAGWPSPAEEELTDTMNLEEWLVHNREATFMLKVSGDSMIDAGIHPGDMLLVERGRTPKNGDIVVAEVDSQWTLKYFEKRGAVVTLVPANKKYHPITPKQELNIAAVVMAVIRKYHA